MTRLCDALGAMRPHAGGFQVDAPPEWSQGRTLYGGMTAAFCHQAAVRGDGAGLPLRSAQILFTGPATGILTLNPEMLRSGRSALQVGVDCRTEGGTAARAGFIFGAPRESRILYSRVVAPLVRPPEDCPIFLERTGGFHDNFELKLGAGSPLISGSEPKFSVWVRFRHPPGGDPEAALLALADALPPAAMAGFPEPAPISTMSWAIDIAALSGDIDGWHLLRASGEAAGAGYSMQNMDLWDRSGTHLASGRQMVAIFV